MTSGHTPGADVHLATGEPTDDVADTPGPVLDDPPVTDTDPDALVDDEDRAPSPWRRRLRAAVPWVVAAIAVAIAVVATLQWQSLAAVERDRDDVALAASEFSQALTNWDASDGMADTREALVALGTDRFASDVAELFGPTEGLAALEQLGARSEGDVQDAYVRTLGDERAEVLVSVLQRITADVSDGAEVTLRFALLELVRGDERWLVDEVELLVDQLRAAPTPLPGGTELTPGPEDTDPPEDDTAEDAG